MRRLKKTISSAAAAAFVLLSVSPVSANPQFSRAEAGDIRIEESGAVYNIYSADKSIGAFTSFGNQAGETINSVQASADHSVIFKVTGGSPSEIFGAMNANSHVFLVNPNGILFGPNAQVNAPGLVAAAMDLKSADFDSREFRFTAPAGGGFVRNDGNLKASPGGYVALVGKAVENRGTIDAPGGSAVLASGGAATVGLDGDGGISVKVTEAVDAPVYDLSGNRIENGLDNSGRIAAAGGAVVLTADAMEQVFDQAINHAGVIEAVTVEEKNGTIVLGGGSRGIVAVDGVLDASGSSGEKGGAIEITGEYVGLADHASLDASGGTGGGEIRIGGDYKGENPDVPNAKAVFFASDASVRADAETSGDGGKVIVWSDEATQVYGSISARGAAGGDGGFVETSSPNYLAVNGARVLAGRWLLDPFNVTISAATDSGGAYSGTNPVVWTPSAGSSNVQVATLLTSLDAGTDVIVSTSGGGIQPGNITLSASLSKTGVSASTLTLLADGSIFINSPITSSSSKLDVELFAGSTTGSRIDVLSSITTNGGDLTIDAPSGPAKLGAALTTNGGDVSIQSSGGLVELAGSVNIVTSSAAAAGDVFIDGPMVPVAAGVDLTIDTHNISAGAGGDVYLYKIMSNAIGGHIVNDFVINAGGSPRGDVTLIDSFLFGPNSADTPSVAITGGDISVYGQILVTGASGITLDASDTVFLGFLNANSDGDNLDIGNVSVTAANGIFDINGNAPNFQANTLTLATTAGDVGHAADPLEAQYVTLNGAGVNGVIRLTGFFVPGSDPAAAAGVTITGNRVSGGDNFQEFTTALAEVTQSGNASSTTGGASGKTEETGPGQKQEKKKEEKKDDQSAAAGTAAVQTQTFRLVETPAAFPEEKPVQPSTFQTCAS